MKIIIQKTLPESVMFYIMTFLTIFATGSARTSTVEGMSEYRIIGVVILLFMAPFVISVLLQKRYNKQIVQMLLVLGAYGAFLVVRNTAVAQHLFFRWAWFAFYYITSLKIIEDSIDVLKCVYRITKWLTVIALFFLVATTIFKVNISHNTVGTESLVYNNYYNIYYVANIYRIQIFGIDTYRIQSLFWEPGVYAIFLNFSLLYIVFCKKGRGRFLEILLFFITLILTFSTTGIIVGIGLVSIYLLQTELFRKIRILVALPVMGAASSIMFQVWMDKKATSNFKMMSYGLRVNDLLVGLKLWADNPIFGVGYNNTTVFKMAQGYGRGNSNGLVTWAYTMGVVGMLLVFYPFISNLRESRKMNSDFFYQLVFLGLFVYANLTEPLQHAPFMVAIVAYQYAKLNFKNRYGEWLN